MTSVPGWRDVLAFGYPALFGWMVPLHLYSRNTGETRWAHVWPVLAVIAAVSLAVSASFVATRVRYRANLVLAILWLGFFFYAPVQRALGMRHVSLAALSLLPLALLVVALGRTRDSTAARLAPPLALAAGVVLAIDASILLSAGAGGVEEGRIAAPEPATVGIEGEAPDVYLVLFDGFAGGEALTELFDYDQAGFARRIGASGFELLTRSRSVYDVTLCSVAALMELEPVCQELLGRAWESAKATLTREALDGPRLLRRFRDAGYRIVLIGGDMSVPVRLAGADRRLYSRVPPYRELLLLQSPLSFLPGFEHVVSRQDALGRRWDPASIRWVLSEVRRVAAEERRPKLVFAHVMSPHEPFYFDAFGGVDTRFRDDRWSPEAQGMEAMRSAYLDQVRYLESLMARLGPELRGLRRGRDDVVVFFSDHGPRWPVAWEDGDSRSLAISRLSTLHVVGGPEWLMEGLDDGTSPANTIVRLTNGLLGTAFAELDDTGYAISPVGRDGSFYFRTFERVPGPR